MCSANKKSLKRYNLNYLLDFSERTETVDELFGSDVITLAEMQRRLWTYIEKYDLIVEYPDNVIVDDTND
jgi:hypothetical protein